MTLLTDQELDQIKTSRKALKLLLKEFEPIYLAAMKRGEELLDNDESDETVDALETMYVMEDFAGDITNAIRTANLLIDGET